MNGPAGAGEVPQGADTLLDVLRAAAAAGYDGAFSAREGGDVDCGSCRNAVNTAALSVDAVHRLEGASDAADLLLVALAQCPVCGARGTLTLGYGPNASASDAAVLPFLDLGGAGPDLG